MLLGTPSIDDDFVPLSEKNAFPNTFISKFPLPSYKNEKSSHTYILVCKYMHTYIHMYGHMYINTYIYTYARTYGQTDARTYIHTYIYTYIHTHCYCVYITSKDINWSLPFSFFSPCTHHLIMCSSWGMSHVYIKDWQGPNAYTGAFPLLNKLHTQPCIYDIPSHTQRAYEDLMKSYYLVACWNSMVALLKLFTSCTGQSPWA